MAKFQKLLLHKPRKLSLYRRLLFIFEDLIYKESNFESATIWMKATNLASQSQYFKAYSLVENFWSGLVCERRALEYLLLKAYLELATGKYEYGCISFEFFFKKLEGASELNIDEKLYLGLFGYQCCSIVVEFVNFNIEEISKYNRKQNIIDYSKVSHRLQKTFPVKKSSN